MALIGAQMYTLRDFCTTPAEVASSCKRVKEMGYDGIQASAGCFNDIDPKELKKILDDNGLVCAATHKPLDWLKDIDTAVQWHQDAGCELTAIGGFGWNNTPREDWLKFITEFNDLATKLRQRGLRVGYHNHSHEFAPFAQDPTKIDPKEMPYQLLCDKLNDDVWFEVDTYWVAHAGADPAAWLEKFAGRLPAIHVKDMTVTFERVQKICEVGAGNLNWPRILDVAKKLDVQWYLVERDSGDVEPFESLKISINNLREMGL